MQSLSETDGPVITTYVVENLPKPIIVKVAKILSKDEENLSRKLSKALRHQAHHMGLNISLDGFVDIEELLNHPTFRGYTKEQVELVTLHNNKKRFTIVENRIRANQGHSEGVQVETELLLTPVTIPFPKCVHGTTKEAMPFILASGLNRMSRQHIH